MDLLSQNFDERNRNVLKITTTFFSTRLEEKKSFDWALGLSLNDIAQKTAILRLLDLNADKIGEPWLTAWRLIEEEWSKKVDNQDRSLDRHVLHRRLRKGEKTGSLVKQIIELVSPKIKIKKHSKLDNYFKTPPKKIRTIDDIFSASLDSCEPFDPNGFLSNNIDDIEFLSSLASKLESSIFDGIDIARRIYSNKWVLKNRLEDIRRVYFVPKSDLGEERLEPDRYKRGFAPAVKLLHEVVFRLYGIDSDAAKIFITRWRDSDYAIFFRLWASLSKKEGITSSEDVGKFLIAISDEKFWKVTQYPEIAELRVCRFSDLTNDHKIMIGNRILKTPPYRFWPRKTGKERIQGFRIYSSLRELKRLEIGGWPLEGRYLKWFEKNINQYEEIQEMDKIDFGFIGQSKAQVIPANPDTKYDSLKNDARLNALNSALNSSSRNWDDDPAERATDWIRIYENQVKVIQDFKESSDHGYNYTTLWESLLMAHSLNVDRNKSQPNLEGVDEIRVLISILDSFPEDKLKDCVNGATRWVQSWYHVFKDTFTKKTKTDFYKLWIKFWPVSIEVTDKEYKGDSEEVDTPIEEIIGEEKADRVDTLNTPVGRMVYLFMEMCPNLDKNKLPFGGRSFLRRIRDLIIVKTQLSSQSGLIARHILIESLGYFLAADNQWAKINLIQPLKNDTSDSKALWRAIARNTQYKNVIEVIGDQMSHRILDENLDRNTRESLLFSLLVEYLGALYSKREPAINSIDIQQTLRSVNSEIRAHGAYASYRFVSELSKSTHDEQNRVTPEKLYEVVMKPFLENVWPQEIYLSTPKISEHFSKIPASSGKAFAKAVKSIERFLMPFECWSMHDYGLDFDGVENEKKSVISNKTSARALLHLLDLTIGTEEGAVLPYDLSNALEYIGKIELELKNDPVFKRLETNTR